MITAPISELLRGLNVKPLDQCLALASVQEMLAITGCASVIAVSSSSCLSSPWPPSIITRASKNAQSHFRPTEPQSGASALFLQNSQVILMHSQG